VQVNTSLTNRNRDDLENIFNLVKGMVKKIPIIKKSSPPRLMKNIIIHRTPCIPKAPLSITIILEFHHPTTTHGTIHGTIPGIGDPPRDGVCILVLILSGVGVIPGVGTDPAVILMSPLMHLVGMVHILIGTLIIIPRITIIPGKNMRRDHSTGGNLAHRVQLPKEAGEDRIRQKKAAAVVPVE
jgi:hypothetical protein